MSSSAFWSQVGHQMSTEKAGPGWSRRFTLWNPWKGQRSCISQGEWGRSSQMPKIFRRDGSNKLNPSVKIMPPLTAFYCDTIQTLVDQSDRRDTCRSILRQNVDW